MLFCNETLIEKFSKTTFKVVFENFSIKKNQMKFSKNIATVSKVRMY